jgi:uncharacterized glyoxalase superfamily protein PhnB
MKINAIADGYHSATPYLIVSGAAAAIDFYVGACGASAYAWPRGPHRARRDPNWRRT